MRNLLILFVYFQLLDLLTTLAFLAHGIVEANPLVRLFVHAAGSPLAGLVAAKLIAFGLALYSWRRVRPKLLLGVNVFYAGVVVWNLTALLLSHPQ